MEISAGFDLDLYFEKFARIARGYAVPEIEWVRRPAYRARCVLCGDGIGTVQHFVNDYKFLAPCRARMWREICSALPFAGEAAEG